MMRDDGWLVAVVEKWNSHVTIRQDLWGFGDLIAVKGDDVLLIQCTSGSHAAHRVAKIIGLDAARIWIQSDHRRIQVHAWKKRGERGKAKKWDCRVVSVGTCDFPVRADQPIQSSAVSSLAADSALRPGRQLLADGQGKV